MFIFSIILINFLPFSYPFNLFEEIGQVCGEYSTSLETSEHFNQFPWFVSIYLKHADYPSLIHASGGTLVSRDLIIAPESIFKGSKPHLPDKFVVFVGESANLQRIQAVQSRTIKGIISNPENQKMGAYADFVLLRLDKPVEFNEHVTPICLCHEDSNWCELRPEQMGYVLNAEPVWTPAIRCPKTFHRKSTIETTICASHLHPIKFNNFTDMDHGLNTIICAEFSNESCNHKTRSGLYVQSDQGKWFLKGVDYIPSSPFKDHFQPQDCPKHLNVDKELDDKMMKSGDKETFHGFVDISRLTNWIQSHM